MCYLTSPCHVKISSSCSILDAYCIFIKPSRFLGSGQLHTFVTFLLLTSSFVTFQCNSPFASIFTMYCADVLIANYVLCIVSIDLLMEPLVSISYFKPVRCKKISKCCVDGMVFSFTLRKQRSITS